MSLREEIICKNGRGGGGERGRRKRADGVVLYFFFPSLSRLQERMSRKRGGCVLKRRGQRGFLLQKEGCPGRRSFDGEKGRRKKERRSRVTVKWASGYTKIHSKIRYICMRRWQKHAGGRCYDRGCGIWMGEAGRESAIVLVTACFHPGAAYMRYYVLVESPIPVVWLASFC